MKSRRLNTLEASGSFVRVLITRHETSIITAHEIAEVEQFVFLKIPDTRREIDYLETKDSKSVEFLRESDQGTLQPRDSLLIIGDSTDLQMICRNGALAGQQIHFGRGVNGDRVVTCREFRKLHGWKPVVRLRVVHLIESSAASPSWVLKTLS